MRIRPAPSFLLASCLVLAALTCLPACGGGGGGGGAPPPPAGPTAGTNAAQIGANTLLDATGATLQFFGQGANDAGDAVSYAWDFDGDGTTDDSTQAPTASFAGEGLQEVTLTVTDPGGNANTATAIVGAFDSLPTDVAPVLSLRVWVGLGTGPCEVFAMASAEDPDGGAITDYAFDFDGDGTADASGASPTAIGTVTTAGATEVTVTATDDEGDTSTVRATVVLCADLPLPDSAPSAAIHAAIGDLVNATGNAFTLRALGCDHDGGALATIAWDLDDDGVFDDATGRETSIGFATEGVHRVRVRLTDDEGNPPAEAEIRLLASNAIADDAPAAWAYAEQLLVPPGTPLQLHGRAFDPTGQPLTFAWDIDGDGTTDSALPDPTFAFSLPGVYRPRLTVTDTDGNVSAADMTVRVERCSASAPATFHYGGSDVVLLQGGTGALPLTPDGGLAGAPTQYSVIYKSGPPTDAAATDLTVRDDQGAAVPPVSGPESIPGGGTIPLALASQNDGGGPLATRCHTIGVRIVEPGVRVQVLTCQVCVIDGLVSTSLFSIPGTNDRIGLLQVGVDASLLTSIPGTLPDIFEIQIAFADFTPVLSNINSLGPSFLQSGWGDMLSGGGYRLFTTTNPIPPTGAPYSWQFEYDTSAGAGLGAPITAGRLQFFDDGGNRIGTRTIPLP